MHDSQSSALQRRIGKRRQATTLVEVLGTLSVLLVLGVSAASILGAITQVGVQSNLATNRRASVERLAKHFRNDVHHAQELSVVEAPLTLDISIGSQTVHYEWRESSGSIWRRVSEGETQVSIESFELSGGFQPGVSLTDDVVTLRLGDFGRHGEKQWLIEAKRG